jgi:hypothetical protein
MNKTEFVKIICPNCGKRQYVNESFEMITCKYCKHQWLKSKIKQNNLIGILLLILYIAGWIFISEIIKIKTSLSFQDSFIIGLLIFLAIVGIIEIFIRLIQYLSKKK